MTITNPALIPTVFCLAEPKKTGNYDLSRKIIHTLQELWNISKITIAVIVDGEYIKDEHGNSLFAIRNDIELGKIKKKLLPLL